MIETIVFVALGMFCWFIVGVLVALVFEFTTGHSATDGILVIWPVWVLMGIAMMIMGLARISVESFKDINTMLRGY